MSAKIQSTYWLQGKIYEPLNFQISHSVWHVEWMNGRAGWLADRWLAGQMNKMNEWMNEWIIDYIPPVKPKDQLQGCNLCRLIYLCFGTGVTCNLEKLLLRSVSTNKHLIYAELLQTLLDCLQCVITAAARLIFGLLPVALTLLRCSGLFMSERVKYKLRVIVFKALHGTDLAYIS